jgi:hypothetical protein
MAALPAQSSEMALPLEERGECQYIHEQAADIDAPQNLPAHIG